MESAGNATVAAQSSVNATYDQKNPFAAAVIGVLAVVGIVGNSLVVFIVVKYRDMHSVTNAYICNLARTDICFLAVCATPAVIQLINGDGWTLGDFMCRFTVYMQSVSVQATVGTFTAMTVDRCAVIFNPLTSRARRTKTAVRIIISLIWITSCLMHLPVVLFFGAVYTPYNKSFDCTYLFSHPTKFAIYTTYEVLVMYVVPLAIIGTSNVGIAMRVSGTRMPANIRKCRGGRRAAESSSQEADRRAGSNATLQRVGNADNDNSTHVTTMVSIIIIFFAVCWGPGHALRMYMVYSERIENFDLILGLNTFTLCLQYFNAAANPFLYAFLGRNFRDHLKVRCHSCILVPKTRYVPTHYHSTDTTRRSNALPTSL
ncbi:G-protein coupled receptor 54-like [Ptychodera flava]|uniref:G-protein coupled receptor 54-like n=1 Tax=Ptychodera flava TaxID=63121 RepID=UPI00396A5367